MMELKNLVRENILALKPYSSARSLYTKGILMDANENPFNLFDNGISVNRYPDGSNFALRQKLSNIYNMPPENCAVGNGSDEIIDVLIRIFCVPGRDEVIISNPTYGVYQVFAETNDIQVKDIPLKNWQPDVDEIIQNTSEITKLIFICSPNNPTGNVIEKEGIIELAEHVNAIIVVDEAYAEFMQAPSVISEIKKYNNLVVLRTLSKAYALAGVRLGYCFADKEIIDLIQKVKLPYNVSEVTTQTVLKALENRAVVKEYIGEILSQRAYLTDRLNEVKSIEEVFSSEANFILFRIKNADIVFEKLVQKGVIIRSRTKMAQLENCLRVSVGSKEENIFFIESLNEIVKELKV